MISLFRKPVTPWPFIVLFFILSISTIVAGLFYYRNLKKQLLEEAVDQLSAIADMKVRQISHWRQERISDGIFLKSNVPHVKQLMRFLENDKAQVLKEDLSRSFEGYIENYDYRNILLLDKDYNVRLYHADYDTVVGEHLMMILPSVFRNGEVMVTDLHKTGMVSFYHLDLVVPLRSFETRDTAISAMVVMRIDPEKMLFPLIESWPLSSKSAEALLLHIEGDDVVYLSRQRNSGGSGIGMRITASEDNLPSSLIINGLSETVHGIDYRGEKVVAALKKIPSTPWYLITKIDREEIYASLTGKYKQLLIIITLAVIMYALFLIFLWWNQRAKFYKEKYEAELDRLALVRHFDYILKYANDIILLFDRNCIVVEANDRAIDIYGYDRDEFIGKKISSLRTPVSIKRLDNDISVLERKGYYTFETIHRRKDGTEFPIEISARKVDIEGAIYYQSIGRDISERKEAEEILMESEERFRKIFEDSPFGMIMTGKDMGIIKANTAICNMLGFDEEELTGLTFRDFTHPDHIEKDQLSILRLIAREIPIYNTEKRYIRKDGSVIWGSTTVNIIRNKEGEARLLFAMIQDITIRKKAEADLIAAKEKAEESDRLKTAFLHNVSHEIRTPMNAILGFSSLLNEPGIEEAERMQFAEIISQSSGQLLSIINDIVDLASVESGQVKLNMQIVNINEELRKLNEQFIYNQKPDGVMLKLITKLEDKFAEIFTDKTKFIQILSNLINNAFKFTKKGEISFGYNPGEEYFEFFVKDTGPGISPEYHERVFERFYQVDSAISRQYSGTGLGLSICKAYVELLGGKIWLTSAPGTGSTFIFTIPRKTKEG